MSIGFGILGSVRFGNARDEYPVLGLIRSGDISRASNICKTP